jgi:hypothetical protein
MDGAVEGGAAAWLIDAGAALLFAAAAAFAGVALVGPQGAALGGSVGFGGALLFLRSVEPGPRQYRMAKFEPADWAAPEGGGDAGAHDAAEEQEPLLLNDVLTVAEDSRVVQLFAARPLPSPGELKARIDAHLADREPEAEVVRLPVDASAALRDALADLRRSLG